MDEMSPEVLHASAIQFLIYGRSPSEEKAANVLLSCTLDCTRNWSPDYEIINITLSAPRIVYETLLFGFGYDDFISPSEAEKEYVRECKNITWRIKEVFNALIPVRTTLGDIHVRAQLYPCPRSTGRDQSSMEERIPSDPGKH